KCSSSTRANSFRQIAPHAAGLVTRPARRLLDCQACVGEAKQAALAFPRTESSLRGVKRRSDPGAAGRPRLLDRFAYARDDEQTERKRPQPLSVGSAMVSGTPETISSNTSFSVVSGIARSPTFRPRCS